MVFDSPLSQSFLILLLCPSDCAVPIVELAVYIRHSECHIVGKGGLSFEMVWYDVFCIDKPIQRENDNLCVILDSLIIMGVLRQEVSC